MLDLHGLVEVQSLRDLIEVIFEQVCFKHTGEISREFLPFLNYNWYTWKQLFRLSEISAISGTWLYSIGYASYLVNSNSTSLLSRNLMKKSITLLFYSFSKYSSKNISILPETSNLPPLLF
jgi:hypothetical protein